MIQPNNDNAQVQKKSPIEKQTSRPILTNQSNNAFKHRCNIMAFTRTSGKQLRNKNKYNQSSPLFPHLLTISQTRACDRGHRGQRINTYAGCVFLPVPKAASQQEGVELSCNISVIDKYALKLYVKEPRQH